MTNEQVKADIAANLPDNTSGLITPAKLRTELGTMVDYSDTAVAGHDASPKAHLNIQRRTLIGNLVLTASDLPLQRIVPDADRDVTLPAEGTAQWRFEICHGGSANIVVVKRAGGTAVASFIAGAPVVVAWDGVAFGIC